jgi:cytochrome P450
LLADSDSWLHQRKLVLPAFHADRLKGYAAIMAEEAARASAAWTSDSTRDVHSDMMHMTLQIVTRTLFGIGLANAVGSAERLVSTLMDEFNRRIAMPVRSRVPLPTLRTVRVLRAMRELDGIAYRAIRDRRASPDGDLLSMLVSAQDEDGRPMSDREVRNAAIAVFFAGHETTACLLSWTLYALGGRPDIEAEVVAEMAREDASHGEPSTLVERLPYLQAVLNEVLRLYPPAYAFGRRAVRDTFVGEHRVPAGTTVLMSPWAMHRDPRYFDHPDDFDPARWRNGLASRLPRFAYFPFSSGPRRCVGSSYAMMEATIALSTFLPRFRLERTGDVEAAPSITLRPRGGMPMAIRGRDS